jgi:hypothetical protein
MAASPLSQIRRGSPRAARAAPSTRSGVALDGDRGAVGGDLCHVAAEFVAVEAHRDDRVRARLAGRVAQPLDRLQAASESIFV